MFKSRSNTIGKVATTVFNDDGWTVVKYHQTDVVRFNERFIVLDSGGWQTATTKVRINQTSGQFDLKFHLWQTDFTWIVKLPNGNEVPFKDGLKIDRLTKDLYQDWTVDGLAAATLTQYSGDVNPEYGGLFVDVSTWSQGWVGLTQITDLSNCNADWIVQVDQGSLSIPRIETIRDAIKCSGRVFGQTSKDRQMSIVESLVWYMGFDVSRTIRIQTNQDSPMTINGIKADIRLSDRESLLDWLVVNQGWIET